MDSSHTEPDNGDDMDITDTIPVVVAAAHRREPAKGAQLAKLASLGVAGAVLCGAVAVSSMVAQRRDGAHQALRPVMQITGEQALLPDKLDETLPKTPAPVPTPPPVVQQERPTPNTAAPVPLATPESFPGGTTASGAVVNGPETDLQLVREFYENLPNSPAEAFGMLSPNLMNTGLGEFLESWSRVVSIDSVDVAERADGVLATVQMSLLDGGRLRIQQLLTVAESPRRIVGVQLLSAQRN